MTQKTRAFEITMSECLYRYMNINFRRQICLDFFIKFETEPFDQTLNYDYIG